jgi:predicted hotdog family 3-hydroxylacyl-ACP dehydratase
MLLIERVVESSPTGVVCLGRVPADWPLARGTAVTATVGLELAAQAAAVHQALGRPSQAGRSRPGYLVFIRDAELLEPEIRVDEPLLARVREAGSAHPLHTFSVEVRRQRDGRVLLTASIGTYGG